VAEPASWEVLLHVQAALGRITLGNGFYTDIGTAPIVVDGTRLPADDQLQTFIYSTDAEVNEGGSGKSHTSFGQDLVIETAVPFGVDDNPFLFAHRVRADLFRALVTLRKSDLQASPLSNLSRRPSVLPRAALRSFSYRSWRGPA
jgi:hypothetical protein